MRLRKYQEVDKVACLSIFDSNVPNTMSSLERSDFADFLDEDPDHFFVVENDAAEVIACGGFQHKPSKKAIKLRWGMVSRMQQKKGYGRFLLISRLRLSVDEFNEDLILVDTSQFARGFYERHGFVPSSPPIKDGLAPGFDDYELSLSLEKGSVESFLRAFE